MFDHRPKLVPVKRAAEFALMTFSAITGIKRTKSEVHGAVALFFADVQAARAMATFAANVHQLGGAKYTAITGRAAEARRVTTNASGISVRFAVNQGGKAVGVCRSQPGGRCSRVAGKAFFGAHIRCRRAHAGNHVRAQFIW